VREYLPGLDGELVDVTGFSCGQPSQPRFNEPAFRASITPGNDYATELLGLGATLALLAPIVVLVLWWLYG
jgi:hypothetical protein